MLHCPPGGDGLELALMRRCVDFSRTPSRAALVLRLALMTPARQPVNQSLARLPPLPACPRARSSPPARRREASQLTTEPSRRGLFGNSTRLKRGRLMRSQVFRAQGFLVREPGCHDLRRDRSTCRRGKNTRERPRDRRHDTFMRRERALDFAVCVRDAWRRRRGNRRVSCVCEGRGRGGGGGFDFVSVSWQALDHVLACPLLCHRRTRFG